MIRAALALALAALAGCAFAGSAPDQTPVQIAATICPGLQGELDTLQNHGVFPSNPSVAFGPGVIPSVSEVCGISSTATEVSLRALAQVGVPAIIAAINRSSLSISDKTDAALIINGVPNEIAAEIPPRPVELVTAQ